MDVSNGIATLGLTVKSDGVEQATQGLDKLAVSADKVEASTKRIIGTNDGLTASQRQIVEQMQRAQQAAQALDGTNSKAARTVLDQIEAVRALATQTNNLGLVQQQLGEATATVNNALNLATQRYTENRAIVLQHMEALKLEAEMQQKAALAQGGFGAKLAEVSGHLDGHNFQLGRLEHGLAAVTGHAIGLNGPMERLGSIFLNMGVGGVWGFAIIGGLAAITALFEHMTAAEEKAEKAAEKLIAKLREQHQVEEEGKSGKALDDLRKRIEEDQKAVDAIQQKIASPTSNRTESVATALASQLKDAENALAEDQHLLEYGGKDLTDKLQKNFDEQQKTRSEDLAKLVAQFKGRADLRQKAIDQEKIDIALETQLIKAGLYVRASLYAEGAKALEKALHPDKVQAQSRLSTLADLDPDGIITKLRKQLEEMRKVNEEQNVANVQREYEIKLVGMVGYMKDILIAQEKAELATLKARHELFGIALSEALAMIQADKDADIAKAKLLRTRQEEIDTIKMFDDITKDVTKIGKRNEAEDKKQINDAAKKIKDAQTYQDELEKIARNGIERIVSHGMKSYQDFFGDILKTFSQLMDAMEREAKKHNTTPGGAFKALGVASAGIGGALAGYDIGHSTGSAVLGAAGGALSGYELGNAILPGIGGVVGALAGFAGGLFGASRAAKEAAAALDQLKQLQLQQTLAAWKASITGLASDQRLANELDLKYKYLSIRQTIEQVEAGKKMEDQRNKDLQEADDLYKQAQAKLTDSTNALTNSMLNAVAGYKYQAAIFAAADVHAAPGAPIPSAPPTTAPASGGGGGYTGGTQTDGSLTVKVVLGDGSVLGTAVLADFKRRAARKGLNTSQWSQIS